MHHHLDHVRLFFDPTPPNLSKLSVKLQNLNGTIRAAKVSRILGQADLWAHQKAQILEVMTPDQEGSPFELSLPRSVHRQRGANENLEWVYPLYVHTDEIGLTCVVEAAYKQAVQGFAPLVITLDYNIHDKTWLEIGFRSDNAREVFLDNVPMGYKKIEDRVHFKKEGKRKSNE
jgi:hypothetical protein